MNFELSIRTNHIIKKSSRLCAILSLILISPQLLAEEKGFFFEIAKDGKTAYVFGSSHAGGAVTYPLRPEIESVLNQAPCIAKELPPDAPATVAAMVRSFLLPEGQVLGDQLTPEVRDRFKKFLKKYRYPATTLAPYKVWAAADTIPFLAAKASPPRDLGAASKSLDTYLAERARARKVRLLGIETVEEQVASKNSLSIAEQQALLIEVLDVDDSQEEAEQWMARQFSKGDIDAMREEYRAKESNIPAHGEAFDKFVYGRNGTQAERIDEMVRDGSECVFAIGALHLGGEDGVMSLLRKRGYQVKQL